MARSHKSPKPVNGRLWRFGQVAQGVVLGILLAVAVLKFIALESGAVTFVYQAF